MSTSDLARFFIIQLLFVLSIYNKIVGCIWHRSVARTVTMLESLFRQEEFIWKLQFCCRHEEDQVREVFLPTPEILVDFLRSALAPDCKLPFSKDAIRVLTFQQLFGC